MSALTGRNFVAASAAAGFAIRSWRERQNIVRRLCRASRRPPEKRMQAMQESHLVNIALCEHLAA